MSLMFMTILFFSLQGFAQNNKLWTKSSQLDFSVEELQFRKSEPTKGKHFELDLEGLKAILATAPNRSQATKSNVIINFPNANGNLEAFRVMEASIMHPDLQASYPQLRSYVGTSLENPSKTIRFSVTPKGLHTMTLSGDEGAQFIDPFTKNGNNYIVYAKRDLPALENDFICGFENDINLDDSTDFDLDAARNANDGNLRNFRLAIATTIEYSSFHWMAAGLTAAASQADKKTAVMDAMITTMTRVNGIYERDLSITMTFVANNNSIIFIDSDTFNNTNANVLINQSQSVIDSNIGLSNYDIGHTFSTGGGGLASLNSPCTSGKARGITGSSAPVGDAYDIDYVAHEMGHQFGAPHTFNGSTGNCAGGNRTASNAYEPGSGSTIMAYAGICSPQDVQSNGDAYFHQKSLQMIWANITSGNSTCASLSATGNAAPTADAGTNYNIPISTPYMLVGSSTDADGTTTHTYTWEQYDLGPTGTPTETTASGPLVRSVEGTNNPIRYIPNIAGLIQTGGSTTWEKLASVNRNINFQLTVRDNDMRGGQTATDNMSATVVNSAGPFAVTSQNTATTWSQGNTETITWNVAGTDMGTVNTPNVDILLSTNGGVSFETVLATQVPNSGSYDIIVPNILAENCIVMVKGYNNIFFNINMARIAIGYNLDAGEVCTTYSFDLGLQLASNSASFQTVGVNVPDSGIITDVNVKYDITSSALNQLHMAIVSPENTRAYLYPAGPCSTGANMQVTWDFESTNAVVCGTDPVTGIAEPVATQTPLPLNAIYGDQMNGSWGLQVANIGPSTMIFNSADLEICYAGTQAFLAPSRSTQTTVQVNVESSAIIADTNLVVTSPNTTNASEIQFTVKELPTVGTLFLNGAALGLNSTFTQADINSGNVTYTTTSAVDATDGFRVDVDDNNGGSLPNLLVNIQVTDGLSVDEFGFDVFSVYPNPSNGNITILLNTFDDVSVTVFDISGRSVYQNNFVNNASFKQELDLSSVSTGVYLLKVQAGSKSGTKKIIIK